MKEKQKANPVVNVSQETKDRIKELKEKHELTDKEMIDVLLNVFDNSDSDTVKDVIDTFNNEKESRKMIEKIHRLQAKLEKINALENASSYEEVEVEA